MPKPLFFFNQFVTGSGITVRYGSISGFVEKIIPSVNLKTIRNGKHIFFQAKNFNFNFLSKSDLERVNGFKALKKQVEWLSGRCLIKQMVVDLLNTKIDMEDVKITYGAQGAPYLPQFPSIRISLSHSGDLVGGAMGMTMGIKTGHIGLDIEKIRNIPDENFMKIAFTDREIEDMRPYISQDVFSRWTIKEAFLKYIQKGFHESLHKVEIIGGRIFYKSQLADVRVLSKIIENHYALSLVTGKGFYPFYSGSHMT